MRCHEVMNTNVRTCRLDAQVSECGRLMGDLDIACVPILDYQRRLVGALTDRELALRVVGEGRSVETRISSVMSSDILTCTPEDSVQAVEAQIIGGKRSCAIVTDGQGHVVGVVTLADIARGSGNG
jgi:CBS domain-containing protein